MILFKVSLFVILFVLLKCSTAQVQQSNRLDKLIEQSKPIQYIGPILVEEDHGLSQDCHESLKRLLLSSLNGHNESHWTKQSKECNKFIVSIHVWRFMLAVMDANAALPSSIYSDSMTSLGGFHQCMSIQPKQEDNEPLRVYGKYCLLQIRVHYSNDSSWRPIAKLTRRFPLSLGLCIPQSCGEDDVNQLFAKC